MKALRNEKNRNLAKSIASSSPLLEKVSRYLLGKYRKSRMPAFWDRATIDDILASGLFDRAYYQKSAGKVFSSDRKAVLNYLTVGEKTHLRPSQEFDPQVYVYGHRDLFDLKTSPIVHYLKHGAAEKRITSLDFDAMSSPGKQPFRADRPTVLLASHEASMTGAPILGCNITEHLAQTCNVVSLFLKDGVLVDNFRENASLVLVAPEGTAGLDSGILADRILSVVKERHGLDYVLANSIEAATVSAAAQGLGVPAITLMHEFAEYVVPQQRVVDMVTGSQLVVFSSELTAQSALNCQMFNGFHNYLVLPQGKSKIPVNAAMPASAPLAKLMERQQSDHRFLVIGCGFVQIRKGVDLFISVAHRLVRKLGHDKVRFVWVGDGYDPKKDVGYSVWLRDQIARSGLQDVVTILPGVTADELEGLYAGADAMMMSSRLDPFPNVTIDAMQAGVPVVSFDGASGTAEFLRNIPQFEPLVAPYLDVDAAADILARLATAPDFHRDISAALKVMSTEAFDMRRYVNKLMEILKQARTMSDQEKLDFETLSQPGTLSDTALGNALGPTSSPQDRIKKYLRFAACGVQGVDRVYRRPIMGFSPHIYVEHHPELEKPPFANPLAHWIRAGRPEGRWYRNVARFEASPQTREAASRLKVALHIHLHYPEILDEILTRIERNLARPDLLISVTSEAGHAYVSQRLSGYKGGKSVVRQVPNLGRDLGPMITEFGSLLGDYDVVGHIHGKKSVEISVGGSVAPLGDVWREFLFENLVGGKTAAIDEALAAFEQNSQLGLIFPEDPNVVGWTENYQPAKELLARLGVPGELPGAIEFPVGNMFYARPQALAPIFKSGLNWHDYPQEPLGYDGTMLHALERITPFVCEAQGYTWLTSEVDGFGR